MNDALLQRQDSIPPHRPALRYHGGKWRLAPWIISHMPKHRVYVEPFGGAMSVLLRKPRSYAEVYNDLDGDIVNVFTVIRDYGEELQRRLELTPFSRDEFNASWFLPADPIERARRTIFRSFAGFGSAAATICRNDGVPRTGFRANSNRSGTTPAHDWANYPHALGAIVGRLQGVVIENKGAIDVIQQHDSPDTLFYIDPPYVKGTRSDPGNDYRYEMTDDDHEKLIDVLINVKGMVLVSGYDSDLYSSRLSEWEYIRHSARADGASKRTEVLWKNARAQTSLRLL